MKKRVLSILLVFSIIVCGLSSFAFGGAAADEMYNVTVKAASGGKVSTDGTNWSDSVVVPVAKGATLGGGVQYKPDEGYKLDDVTVSVVIKKIAASASNTAAIDDAGNLYTAGDNSRGQLARKLGSYVYEDSVLTKVNTSAKIIDVAMGANHIVVLDENGEVWTAGCNQYGALGIDKNAGRYWYGTEIDTLGKVTVGDGSVKIKAVAAGQYHTILIDENGGVWTAGYNSDGQLGRSENVNSGTPNTVFKKPEGLDNVKIVGASGGTAHTVLLDESGNVWTAGNNLHGQLGRQTASTENPAFEKITDGISGVKITAIAAGSNHSVMLDENGNVWTTGSNLYGELGRETNDNPDSLLGKADLQGATAARFIAAGNSTTIVIDTDGNVRTCGTNGFGQLGRDTGSESSDSKLLAVTDGIDGAEIIAAATGLGAYHSVLLDKNGVIRTCGSNQCGQLCRDEDLRKSVTFAPVTDGMIQTITFEEMKNTVITSDRAFTVNAAAREKVLLEYDLDGGEWADGFTPRDFLYKDEGFLLPDASNIEKTGHTFVEWEVPSLTANPVKCIAKWKVNSYTITVKPENGEDDITITEAFGTPISAPSLKKQGYIFAGWDNEFPAKMPAGDQTITAQWTVCDHSGNTAKPTCTDPSMCTVCGGNIAALGHDFSVRQHDGNEHWNKCSRCDATDDKVPHEWDSGRVTTPATCTEAGERVFSCDVCGAEKIESIDAEGHDLVFHAGKAATCVEIGWEDYYTCSRCNYTTYKEIPATGNHTYEWESDNGQYWQKCSVCNKETEKKAIPVLTISGNDKVCRTQDYTFGFVLPDGCRLIVTGYEFEKIGSELEALPENGNYTVVVASSGYPAEESDFKVTVTVETEDGFTLRSEKIVSIIDGHSGGEATCTEKAVCEICGEAYGELNPQNHTGEEKWEQTETKHTKKWDCCGTVTVEEADHAFENGVCTVCQYACGHKGGTATCKEKAVCEICGEAYGELDANNHKELTHVEAKEATKEEEGNTEYWYCKDCGKYYSDKDGEKEIAKADTVIPKVPQTGDESSNMLLFALLFLSAGALAAVVLSAKKKDRVK